MKQLSALFAFLMLLIPAGCVPSQQATDLRGNFPNGAMLAAFEVLIPPENDSPFVSCLQVDKRDPPTQVITALLAEQRAVVPASDCTYIVESTGSFHNKTQKKAMFHRLTDLKLTSENTATVHVSSYHHGLFGSFGKVLLAKKNGQWRAMRTVPGGVS